MEITTMNPCFRFLIQCHDLSLNKFVFFNNSPHFITSRLSVIQAIHRLEWPLVARLRVCLCVCVYTLSRVCVL